LKAANTTDFAVIALYMILNLGIGVYFMRFNRGASDYFRGSNRIPWLVAGLSSFMSGFSAWTFTGAAGVAYQQGIAAVLLYVGNACSFLLGYFVFGSTWRRARVSTTMEYLADRFNQSTRQIFSWTTILFQIFMAGSMLYGLGLFVASASGASIEWTIFVSGAVIIFYCVVGGLWAVVITDFLQAVVLLPFTLVLAGAALWKVGGLTGLWGALPPGMLSLKLPMQFGWGYVAAWTVMVSFGYNTSAMAQRYFSVDDERSARKVALLCFVLFLSGACVWFIPPMAMRVLYPDLRSIWPGVANAHEAAYAVASLTLLPNGLVGIMLASMFSATMSSLSGLYNVYAAIISKDIYQTLFERNAGEMRLLVVGWIATLGVGIAVTATAIVMAATGQSIFQMMLTFNTIMSLAYGPPALLGLVVRRTPSWSGLASFSVSLVVGCLGAFVYNWGLITNVVVIVPVSVVIFLLSGLVPERDEDFVARRELLIRRLDTAVDVSIELRGSADMTTPVFRFLSAATAGIGLLSLCLLFTTPAAERATVLAYATVTLLIAALLRLVRGRRGVEPA
jgi:solute:Na+ symporter, SSS family